MANQAKVAEIYADLVLNTAKFKAAMQDATNETKKFSAQMRSQMNDARGATRLVTQELGIHMPRALQGFVAKLPGVATAMSAAFNTIAIIALVNIVVQAGEKIAEFVSKTQEAAQKNKQAWEGITVPLRIANDEMLVANDRLANSIAKLEHKPHNGIKEAIDEAVLSADKLSQKLTEDLNKIQETLKSTAPGIASQIFGEASTTDLGRKYADLQARITAANQAGGQRIKDARGGSGTDAQRQAAVESAKKALSDSLMPLFAEGAQTFGDALNKALAADASQRNVAKSAGLDPTTLNTGMTSRIQAASSLNEFYKGQQTALQLGATNDTLNAQEKIDQAKQDNIDAAKKAAAELLKTFETEYQSRKAIIGMSLSQEASFWNSKLSAFKNGSEQYLAVLSRFATASQAEGKYLAEISRGYRDRTGAPPGLTPYKSQDADTVAIARGLEQQAAMSAAITEATTKYKLAIGAISEHDAALTLAAAHTDEYKSKLATLTAELAKLHAEEMDIDGKNVDPANAARQTEVQNQINDLSGKRGIQVLADTQAGLNTTWKGMIDSVFDSLIAKSRDTTSQIKEIASSTVNGINEQLARGITGQKTNFRGVGQSAGESLTKAGLGKLEGLGLSALGFGGGKRDGSSASTALFVQMATPGSGIPGLSSTLGLFGTSKPNVTGPGGVGVASSATHGLLGLLNSSNWASSLFGGKLFGGGSLFGGGFATGGDVQAGVPIDVGEMGIERFTPSVPGHITPNKDLRSNTPSIGYIDARGTDPVTTHAAVTRAMQETHKKSVRDASHATAEHARRTPNR